MAIDLNSFYTKRVCSQQVVLPDLPGDYFSLITVVPCTVMHNLKIFIF